MNDMAATLAKPGQLLQTEPERMLRHCLPEFVRAASELLPPETFDALGYAALLRRLHEDTDDMIYAPGFERTIEQPIAGAIAVPREARLIVSEGNYLLVEDERWTKVRPLVDEGWYVDLDRPERRRER